MASSRGAMDWDAHRRAAQEEDAAFLRAAGASEEEVHARTGLSTATETRRHSRAVQRT